MRDFPYESVGFAFAEFLDNAIDAGATQIETVAKAGERNRHTAIAVVDDGAGMIPDFLPVAMNLGGSSRDVANATLPFWADLALGCLRARCGSQRSGPSFLEPRGGHLVCDLRFGYD